MADTLISVERLGKRYRLQHRSDASYVALRDVIAEGARAFGRRLTGRGKAGGRGNDPRSVEEFWALRDVSFELARGEVLGIIGRNGAGKSTLLKILSRITEPTEGRARLRGRVASLLEVGTGFHPELTGRENIFVNGVILGMARAEMRRKLDAIVAFADVEKFLDTPVKRYSSGMYVRLAFAVAAHLEPEILIVDEVLAVGDAEFQRKCLGRMRDASQHGRTVLFVSHNMAAVQSLCSRALLLDRGRVVLDAPAAHAVRHYLAIDAAAADAEVTHTLSPALTLARIGVRPAVVRQHAPLAFELTLEAQADESISDLALLIHAPAGERAALIDLRSTEGPLRLKRGSRVAIEASVPAIPFVENDYAVGLYVAGDSVNGSFMDLLRFSVHPAAANGVVPREPQFRGIVELRAQVRHAVQATEPHAADAPAAIRA